MFMTTESHICDISTVKLVLFQSNLHVLCTLYACNKILTSFTFCRVCKNLRFSDSGNSVLDGTCCLMLKLLKKTSDSSHA